MTELAARSLATVFERAPWHSVNISSIFRKSTGTGNFQDYSVSSRCPKSLAAGKSCTDYVFYSMKSEVAPKSFPATSSTGVIISYGGPGISLSVPVTAQNINSRPNFTRDSIYFGRQKVGTTSNINTVSLVNHGTTPLTISSINISGDFALDSSTTCVANTSLAPKQSCTFAIKFAPTKLGWRYGQLTVTDNALRRTVSVALSGAGK